MSDDKALSPRPAPARFVVHAARAIHRSDLCINCGTCIEACTYGCHERRADEPRKMADPVSGCCRACYACVLRCPRQALSMHCNAAYETQGDAVYTPEIVRATLDQAAEGKLPVSGAGYGGAFDGEGFDGIWTDMSEIVRPTRDGIHGRERISTAVSLGRTIADLSGLHFDEDGNLRSPIPPRREVSLPVLFGRLPYARFERVWASVALAAAKLTTYATMAPADEPERFREYVNHLNVALGPDEVALRRDARVLEWATIVEFDEEGDQLAAVAEARDVNPHVLTVCRVETGPGAAAKCLELARQGGETLHLAAGLDGRGRDGATMLGCLRDAHERLVAAGLRDRVTLLASGGIASAEHVPKAIVLGADAVVVDLALVIALECTRCGGCLEGCPCPRGLESIDPRWGATRIINLMVAWRDQLLEVLGAMGIRDVRRLRGERGRAIFAAEARDDFRRRLERGASPAAALVPPLGGPPELPASGTAPHRFPVRIGRWRVVVDRARCVDCAICEATCREGVHRRSPGKLHLDEPRHDRCLGPPCRDEHDWCCLPACPVEALSLEPDPSSEVLGDRRWTGGMIRSTAERATRPPSSGAEPMPRTGASGGGFDALTLAESVPGAVDPGPVDLSLALNRRGEGPRVDMPLPFYGGGMSYGSVSLAVMVGRAMAAEALGTFTSTGEGGYPDELVPYRDHVITQVATGLFGVREETIQRARVVEFKYAQGAKPGLGGHLLGTKNTAEVARMREAVPGTSLFSPFPFHSVYSVEDHKKHLDWVRSINPDVILSVKVSTPGDVDMVAVGAYHAGANVIHLDGAYGGTGAAPDIAKKNIAMPIEYAAAQVHDFLVAEGIRDEVTLMVSGGVRTPEDLLKAVALGADGVVLGTAELIAIDCVRCRNCERGRGCPIGIATTDPVLSRHLAAPWVRDRIVNMYLGWARELDRRLRGLGLSSLLELRGRRDLLALAGAAATPEGGRL
jgi:glutamate synthase domain-containing protein 2/formate hydrogenlyase subunit 6/NADH:ubiquinone oxidoreductase subunit I